MQRGGESPPLDTQIFVMIARLAPSSQWTAADLTDKAPGWRTPVSRSQPGARIKDTVQQRSVKNAAQLSGVRTRWKST